MMRWWSSMADVLKLRPSAVTGLNCTCSEPLSNGREEACASVETNGFVKRKDEV